jgi:hypothetical protein
MAAPFFSGARAVMNPPCFTGGDRAKNPAHSLTRRDAVRALITLLPPAFARLKTAKSGLSSIPPARKGVCCPMICCTSRSYPSGAGEATFYREQEQDSAIPCRGNRLAVYP